VLVACRDSKRCGLVTADGGIERSISILGDASLWKIKIYAPLLFAEKRAQEINVRRR
jgi:hypothetical protein